MMLTKDDDCMAYGCLQRADLDATAVPLKLPTKSSSDDEEGDPEFLILIMILMIIMRIKDDKEDADGNATCVLATSWSRSIQALVC